MAPRKRALNAQPHPATSQLPHATPEIPNNSVDNTNNLSQYSELQQNEFLATEAIYPDGFVRIRGRKDAWKNQENLAFQVRLTSLENPEYFVKIDFEFPKDYPKVLPKIGVVEIQPADPTFRTRVEQIVTAVPRQHLGSESVHEITGALDDLLNRTAYSKAAKKTPFSLEEERAIKEAAVRAEAHEQAQLTERQQAAKLAENEQLLTSQLESERKRRQKTASSKTDESMIEFVEAAPKEPVRFDQWMICKDIATDNPFRFKAVAGNYVTLKRSDKINTVVTPSVEDENVQVPQLLLKQILLPGTLAPKKFLQKTMEAVERLLEESKIHRDKNVVDLLGYKVVGPTATSDFWQLSILSEWANSGSLDKLLQLSGALSASKIREWSRQLLDALKFFETAGYVHPAVHAGNVLLFLSREGGITIKLSDGYGTALRELVVQARDPKSPAPPEQALWKAPELNQSTERKAPTCIWDFGRLLLEMAFGRNVFEQYTSPQNCMDGAAFSPSFEDLLKLIFQQVPAKRPTAYRLLLVDFYTKRAPEIFDQGSSNQPATPAVKSRSSTTGSIWHEKWEMIEKLGKGGFGQVVKARSLTDQQIYAVKIIKNDGSDVLNSILEEVHNISTLNHPAIVRYFHSFTEDEEPIYEQEEEVTSQDTDGTSHITLPQMQFRSLPGFTFGDTQGRDIMESSVPSNPKLKGPEYSDSDSDNRFGYQSPADDDDDYDDEANDGNPDEENLALRLSQISDDVIREDDHEIPLNDDIEFGHTRENTTDRKSSTDDLPAVHTSELNNHQHFDRNNSTRKPRISKLFIVMELCEKRNLRSLIMQGFDHDLSSMWRLFRTVLDGLRYIHGKGFVHRDLKPENIFLDSGNNAKIGDFGLTTLGTSAGRNTSSRNPTGDGMQTMSIGTPAYMAPEIRRATYTPYGSKVDMYSMGIILFEMNHHMPLFMERHLTLTKLSEVDHVLPLKFELDEYKVQGKIILQLIDHNPGKRPSADSLLNSGEVPEPLEEETFQRRVTQMADTDRQALVTKMLAKPNDAVQDLAWDFRGDQTMTGVDPLIADFVTDKLRSIFHRHGAVHMDRQAIFPHSNFYPDAITFLGATGLTLQLPKDNTLPFARSIAQKRPEHPKSYSFGAVYRPRKDATPGDEPFRYPEVNFDFISYKTTDLPLKEAEVIYVLDEIIAEIPALASRSWIIVLNHIDLLDLILDYCRVQKADYTKVKSTLSQLHGPKIKWSQVREALRADTVNIPETSVLALERFYFAGSLDKVRQKLTTLLQGDDRSGRAISVLARLGSVITYLERLKVRTSLQISPLSNNSEQLYRGSLVFQCIERSTGRILGAGGRYDSLIQYYQKNTSMGPTRAVGFMLNAAEIGRNVQNDTREVGATKGLKSHAKDRQVLTLPSRCDVLVTSFDVETLSEACLECVQCLWAAGISAELTEEYTSMEQLEVDHHKDGPFWLVIIKGGSFTVDKALKVRSPTREETELRSTDLIGFFKAALSGRQPAPQEIAGNKLHRTASTGQGGPERNITDVKIVAPQHRSKKVNRAMIVESASASARELAQSLAESAPIVGIEVSPEILQQIRNTRLADESTWKALRGNVPVQEKNYMDDLLEELKKFASKGKDGAFIYSYTAKASIYYDFGKAA